MSIVEIGTICTKTSGREKGKKCIIIDIIDKNNVLITGPKSINGVRRRKANIKHLQFTPDKINIKKGASDKVVEGALKKSPDQKEEHQ